MQHPSIATRTRILPGLTAGVVLLTLIGGVVEAIGEDPLKPLELGQVHPGGLACRVQAWKPGYHVARPGDLTLLLTEFSDPGGRAVYFRLPDTNVAVDDEPHF